MEWSVGILLFFTEFASLVQTLSPKYHLIQQGKNWNDAQAFCKAEYTDLAIIKNSEDMIQLQKEAENHQFSSNAWIGLYIDINSWCWSMGNEPLGSMKPWLSGEPDNWKGNEACGIFDSTGWMDGGCTNLNPFVCFDDRYTGNQRYIHNTNTMSWSNARDYCRQHHTDLASSRDATEDYILRGLSAGYTWFGLFRDTLKWADKTNFSTFNGLSIQLDNALKNENCIYLYIAEASDAVCSDILPFFCHADITGQQQIVKVNVRSNEDVNDPAIKATMLEQIKQKLKGKGMAGNFKAKWREQLDGKVFHMVEE